MKKSYFLITLLILASCIGTVQATTWTNAGGCWTATDGAYSIMKWNATGNFSYTFGSSITVEYLVIGSGGSGGNWAGGGGAAGAVVNGTGKILSGTVQGYVGNWTNGSGGSNPGLKGQTSFIADISAEGGGYGGAGAAGGNGGSGGGGSALTVDPYTGTAAGTANNAAYGHQGGAGVTGATAGGGGGGAKTAGAIATSNNGGAGGDGITINITGENLPYGAGGAGGGNTNGGVGGSSGIGGHGSNGGVSGLTGGQNGTGSGGGGQYANGISGIGGSGVVIIRYLTSAPAAPIASFTPTGTTTGIDLVSVTYNDTSTGSPTDYNWTYQGISGGNNTLTQFSTSRNVTASFGVGNFSITHGVSNTYGNNITPVGAWVNVSSSTLGTITSAFTTNVTSGYAPLPILFTDASSYFNSTPATYLWTFGDGNTSTSRNATNLFSTSGSYNVTYRVSNVSMGLSSTSNHTITVLGMSGFNRVDLTMSQQYLFTLNIVDINGNPIPVVLVSDSNGYNATTTNGVFTYQYPYSVVGFYLSSAGYASKSVSYIISDNTTETVVMTAVTTTSQNANVIFSPRSVAIQVLDANYNPIVNDPVYVNAYSSSLPGGLAGAVGYFKTTYGVAESTAQSMFAANTTYYGTTDNYGFVAIQVADIIQYQIITKDTNGVNTSRLMWPSGPYYQIVTDTAAVAGIAAQGRTQANINRNSTFNTTFWEPNTTHSCMGINVYDSTGQTNNVYAWWKLMDNGTVWWTNSTAIGGYGPINSTKCVLHVPYQQWKWGGITG